MQAARPLDGAPLEGGCGSKRLRYRNRKGSLTATQRFLRELRVSPFWVSTRVSRSTTMARCICETNDRGENCRESNRGNGPGCGKGRDEAGGATRAAGSDKRRRRSGPCVGIR